MAKKKRLIDVERLIRGYKHGIEELEKKGKKLDNHVAVKLLETVITGIEKKEAEEKEAK